MNCHRILAILERIVGERDQRRGRRGRISNVEQSIGICRCIEVNGAIRLVVAAIPEHERVTCKVDQGHACFNFNEFIRIGIRRGVRIEFVDFESNHRHAKRQRAAIRLGDENVLQRNRRRIVDWSYRDFRVAVDSEQFVRPANRHASCTRETRAREDQRSTLSDHGIINAGDRNGVACCVQRAIGIGAIGQAVAILIQHIVAHGFRGHARRTDAHVHVALQAIHAARLHVAIGVGTIDHHIAIVVHGVVANFRRNADGCGGAIGIGAIDHAVTIFVDHVITRGFRGHARGTRAHVHAALQAIHAT